MADIKVAIRTAFLKDNLRTSEIRQCQTVRKIIDKFLDGVVIVREVDSGLPAEVRSERLIPACAELESLVLYVTCIYIPVSQT